MPSSKIAEQQVYCEAFNAKSVSAEIERVYDESFRVYGSRKIWRQLNRDHIAVARCTVERLMHRLGLQGTVRGRSCRTTVSDDAADRAADLVNRQCR